MPKHRSIIVGLGQIGMTYDLHLPGDGNVLSHAKALASHPEFDLMGGVDIDPTSRKVFESAYDVRAYETIEEALRSEEPAVVIVSLPTTMHVGAVRQAVQFESVKTILCEKPFGRSPQESQEILSICEKMGVKVFVNYMRRADPAVLEVKKLIESEEILGPIKGLAWYGGGFVHNASHLFDLLEFWLGPMVESYGLRSRSGEDVSDLDCDVCVDFGQGQVTFLTMGSDSFAHYEIELLAKNGRLRFEKAGHRVTWESVGPNLLFPRTESLSGAVKIIHNGMHQFQLNVLSELALAISGRSNHLVSGAEAVKLLKKLTAIVGKN